MRALRITRSAEAPGFICTFTIQPGAWLGELHAFEVERALWLLATSPQTEAMEIRYAD